MKTATLQNMNETEYTAKPYTFQCFMNTRYRANPKVSRNPSFCVGCFELIISKISAAASKMGKNGQNYFFFAIFFRNPFLRRVLDQKLIFLRFFFAFWGLRFIHFVATARNRAYLGLWGNVCPARVRHATFLLTIPTSARDLPSDGEGPPNKP